MSQSSSNNESEGWISRHPILTGVLVGGVLFIGYKAVSNLTTPAPPPPSNVSTPGTGGLVGGVVSTIGGVVGGVVGGIGSVLGGLGL